MSFRPNPDDPIIIDGIRYKVTEHPAAPGSPYGQEGRAGIVYQLIAPDGSNRALKVFKPRYRDPSLVYLADKIAGFSELKGLQVCRREVISAMRDRELIGENPDLIYGVLMPWVAGPTWMEIVLEQRELTPVESLAIARGLVEVMIGMEERGLAHCDLSGPNILIPGMVANSVGGHFIALVDVEQMCAPGLTQPQVLPGGSSGYAHRTTGSGQWNAIADRYAGAILLGEILGLCENRVRKVGSGETYFAADEMQQDCNRFQILHTALRRTWGERAANLLERAWTSDTLADCPTFGEWWVALPESAPKLVKRTKTPTGKIVAKRSTSEVIPIRVSAKPVHAKKTQVRKKRPHFGTRRPIKTTRKRISKSVFEPDEKEPVSCGQMVFIGAFVAWAAMIILGIIWLILYVSNGGKILPIFAPTKIASVSIREAAFSSSPIAPYTPISSRTYIPIPIYGTQSQNEIRCIDDGNDVINAVISPDGTTMASESYNGIVRLQGVP